MVRTNEKHLIEGALQVEVHPFHNPLVYRVSHDGKPFCLPTAGGIVYNVRTGDTAYGWAADHMEPSVTAMNPVEDQNASVQNLVCIGNEAIVVSGDAKGDKGVVVGKHAGAEHTLLDFPRATMEKLLYGDKILIRMLGKGLVFEDYPDVRALCMSPRLIKAMGLRDGDGKLVAPVVATVPAEFMGSGIGASSEGGDYDIMTGDHASLARHGLDKLRLGDFVAIMDHDNRYGRGYRKGAVSVGVVVHADCYMSGHGPGVVVLFSSAGPDIEPVIDSDANLAIRLEFREDWKK